jgi:asparagine synthase (glutamine-hydrolysing)
MMTTMARRGPDGQGSWVADGIALGHRRLSVIDLSAAAGQPMVDEAAGVVIVFNGEIYNYIELRAELARSGHQFRTHGDTEVLLKAYVQWGLGCFSRLIGMWAVALYEIRTRRLILSRDRFGIKPLYLARERDWLVFASTIEAVRAVGRGNGHGFNERVIQSFLLDGEVDGGDETFFDGISRFPAGCYAIVQSSPSGLQIQYGRYWDAAHYLDAREHAASSFDAASAKFREKLEDAIRLHTRSDVEVGSCLSGGLDSSSIVSLLATIPEGASILKVFSAVFPGKPYDESQYSAAVANRYHLNHFRIVPTSQSFIRDIDRVIQAQEEPFGSTGVYVQWKVFEEMRTQGVTVAIDGQGADEYLGGYFSFLFPYAFDCLLDFQPVAAAQAMRSYMKGNRVQHYLFQKWPGLLSRLFGVRSGLLASPLTTYLSDGLRHANDGSGTPQPDANGVRGVGFKKTLVRYLTRYSLPSLLRYEDRNSMWFSIESRVPFLDHRLVEFALTQPSDHLINGHWTKRLLRESVCDIVPTEVVRRKDKIGFGNPESEWVEALIAAGAFRDLLADSLAKDVLDVPKFARLLAERHQRKPDFNFLWRTYNLLAWQRWARSR